MARSHRPSVRGHTSSIMMANFQFVLIVCGVIVFIAINALFALSLIPPVIPSWLTKLTASFGGSFAVIAWLLRFPGVRNWLRQLKKRIDGRIVAIIFAVILTTALIFLGITWLFLLLSHFSLSAQDWSKWNPQGQWQVPNDSSANVLLSDGSAPCCDPSDIDLFSPDTVLLNDYAIEARIQVNGINNSAATGQIYFGIIIRANEDGDGNLLGMVDSNPEPQPTAFFSSIGSDQAPQFFKNYPVLDSNWHVYRIEVRDNTLRFLIDGHLTFQVKSIDYSRNTRFGLVDSGYELEVSDVSVTSLS